MQPRPAVAYVRVSSRQQNDETQRSAIERAAHARGDTIEDWRAEKCSAKTMQRQELQRILVQAPLDRHGPPRAARNGATGARSSEPLARMSTPTETPSFHKAPPGPDFTSLPPGVYYCSPSIASTAGSRGYWTMSCRVDADCPASTKCGNGIACVKICVSDAECPDWAPSCLGNPGTCMYVPPRF